MVPQDKQRSRSIMGYCKECARQRSLWLDVYTSLVFCQICGTRALTYNEGPFKLELVSRPRPNENDQ